MVDLPPVLVFVAGAAVLPLLPRRVGGAVLLGAPLVALAIVVGLEPGTTLTWGFFGYEIAPLRVDGLSLAFAYVFLVIAFLAGLYGVTVMGTAERVAALAYAGSAIGVVFAGDLLSLFVFWELKAIASALLIWMGGRPRSSGAGMRYLFVHVIGGSLLLAGILWHLSVTGSLEFTGFAGSPAAWLILVAFALSAAVPPLHAWCPDGYPEASVPGTVFLSAYTTKAAVYALARGFAGFEVLVWAGVFMALYGVVYAVLENDIRRLLAYHIVSQVGYMVAAVGIGTAAAINGATAHAFAHILYKGLLLMGAGAVLYATGRSKLTELGGLARAMPTVLVLYLIGAFAISGVPLFSGFVSKELAVDAASAQGREAVVQLLKLASVGTFLHTGLKLPYFTWYGPDRGLRPIPVPVTMLAAMGLLAAMNIAIGVAPFLLYDLLPFAVDYQPYTTGKIVEMLQILTFTALGFWLLLKKLGGEPTVTLDTDWLYRGLPRLAAARLPAAAGTVAAAGDPRSATLRSLDALVQRGRQLPVVSTLLSPETDRTPAPPWPLWALGSVVVATVLLLLVVNLA